MCNPAAVQPAEELHARSKGYLTSVMPNVYHEERSKHVQCHTGTKQRRGVDTGDQTTSLPTAPISSSSAAAASRTRPTSNINGDIHTVTTRGGEGHHRDVDGEAHHRDFDGRASPAKS